MIQSLPPPQFGMADSCAHLQSTTLLLWMNHLIISPAEVTEKMSQFLFASVLLEFIDSCLCFKLTFFLLLF